MDGKERRHSDYRGWTLCVTSVGRRKALGYAVRREPPHEIVRAEGCGASLVLKDLRRRVDAVEDKISGEGAGDQMVTGAP